MPPARDPQEKAALILRHARMALESRHYGDELHTMRHMRSRILAYTKGFPGAKEMRSRLVRVSSMPELEDLLSKLPARSPEYRGKSRFPEDSAGFEKRRRGKEVLPASRHARKKCHFEGS